MKMRIILISAAVFGLSGCANLAPSTTTAQANTADKTAGAICATTGAALQSMVIAGATAALMKIKPAAEALRPACNASNPSSAITAAEAQAYTKIIDAAAPYMGD